MLCTLTRMAPATILAWCGQISFFEALQLSKGAPSSLIDGSGSFYKQLQAGPRGARELYFYAIVSPWQQPDQIPASAPVCNPQQQCSEAASCQQLASQHPPQSAALQQAVEGATHAPDGADAEPGDAHVQQQLAALAPWVPYSVGVQVHQGHPYLGLQDVTAGYAAPCIMDIKLGWRTWYPWAPQALQDKYRRKDTATTQSTCGLRICGVQVRSTAGGGLVWQETRDWGKRLQPPDLAAAFQRFASNGALTPADVYHGAGGLLQQLRRLHQVFQQQQLWHFSSASVLLVYEGQATAAAQARPAIRLIDFAHAFPTVHFKEWLAGHDAVLQQQQQQQPHLGTACTTPEARHASSKCDECPAVQQMLATLAACQEECAGIAAAHPPSQVWEGCTAEGPDDNVCTALASLIQHMAAAAEGGAGPRLPSMQHAVPEPAMALV